MKRLEPILEEITEKGEFEMALLCDEKGLTLASVRSKYDHEKVSAISSLVGHVAERAERDLNFMDTDEISMVNEDKIRIVCRLFKVKGILFILVVVTPPYHSYRRLTNAAIKSISPILEERV